jgi:hypothetical protein
MLVKHIAVSVGASQACVWTRGQSTQMVNDRVHETLCRGLLDGPIYIQVFVLTNLCVTLPHPLISYSYLIFRV